MKASSNVSKKKFQPLEFRVIVETEDELRSLWNRMHVGLGYLRKRYPNEGSKPVVDFPKHDKLGGSQEELTDEFFDVIDAACRSRGLR